MTWVGRRSNDKKEWDRIPSRMISLAVVAAAALGTSGCMDGGTRTGSHDPEAGGHVVIPDTRHAIELAAPAGTEHRAVMLQHLETVQQIVAALGREDFELAQRLTEAHLGFFMHRQAMARQKPEDFPPSYHDLAMAHHEAAEALAGMMPSHDLKKILPKLDAVLKACVACHLAFKVQKAGARQASP